jgi:hypothetical protein
VLTVTRRPRSGWEIFFLIILCGPILAMLVASLFDWVWGGSSFPWGWFYWPVFIVCLFVFEIPAFVASWWLDDHGPSLEALSWVAKFLVAVPLAFGGLWLAAKVARLIRLN